MQKTFQGSSVAPSLVGSKCLNDRLLSSQFKGGGKWKDNWCAGPADPQFERRRIRDSGKDERTPVFDCAVLEPEISARDVLHKWRGVSTAFWSLCCLGTKCKMTDKVTDGDIL